MDPFAAITIAVLALTGTVTGSWFVARSSARNVDQQARDSDRRRMKELEDKVEHLWLAREADALIKRRLGDHIDTLEDHIWKGKPPPPPPRPVDL